MFNIVDIIDYVCELYEGVGMVGCFIIEVGFIVIFGSVQFVLVIIDVSEGGGFVFVIVQWFGGVDGVVIVDIEMLDGFVMVGVDYILVMGMLSWVDGDSVNKLFNVLINDDSVVESIELINLLFFCVMGGVMIGVFVVGMICIFDNDVMVVMFGMLQFSVVFYSVNEVDGSVDFIVECVGGSDGVVLVVFVIVSGLV